MSPVYSQFSILCLLCVQVCVCACLAAFEVHYNVNGGKYGDYFPLPLTFLALFAFYKTYLSWHLTYLKRFPVSLSYFWKKFCDAKIIEKLYSVTVHHVIMFIRSKTTLQFVSIFYFYIAFKNLIFLELLLFSLLFLFVPQSTFNGKQRPLSQQHKRR